MSQEVPEPAQAPLTLQNPTDVARAAAGLTLQEATHLGEINPAMARRLGERMDQVFNALIKGAGAKWGSQGDLVFVWPEIENPILAAAKARKQGLEPVNSEVIK